MSDVLDVIHRFSYQIQGADKIQAVEQQFSRNAEAIARNTQSIQRLQAALAQSTNPAQQDRIRQAIQNRTEAIRQQGREIQNTIINDRNYQQTLQREIGILNELGKRLETLRQARQRATSPREIAAYNRQIQQVEAEQRRLSSAGGSRLGGIGNAITQGLGIGLGVGAIQQGVGMLKSLAEEASNFAAEMEGVKPAFEAIDRPDLLGNLRQATKGTVSDLELMKQAVQYNNLGLPIERMATALEFARRRAKETGVDVDYLIRSLVDGIGRQSLLKVDNLGISMSAVKKEMQETGNFTDALFNIIDEGLKKSGTEIETYRERMERLNATIQNNQADLGRYYNFAKDVFKGVAIDLITLQKYEGGNAQAVFDALDARIKAERDAASERFTQDRLYQVYFKKYLDQIGSLDLNARQERIRQAEILFNQDLELQRKYYGANIAAFNSFQSTFSAAFNRFRKEVSTTPINLEGITGSNITSASQTELQSALSLLDGQLSNTPLSDKGTINSINRRKAIIQKALKGFDPVDNAKIAADAKKRQDDAKKAEEERYKKAKEQLDLTDQEARNNDEILRNIQIQRDNLNDMLIEEAERTDISKEYLKILQQQVAEQERLLNLRQKDRINTLDLRRTLAEQNLENQFGRTDRLPALSNRINQLSSNELEIEAELKIAIVELSIEPLSTEQVNDIEQRAKDAIQKSLDSSVAQSIRAKASVNTRQNPLDTGTDRNLFSGTGFEQNIYDSIQLYEMLASAGINAYNQIADANQRQVDREISYQQYRVQQAQILAERGNAEALKLEEERLRELEKQQRESAQRTQVINSALTLSYSIAAIARAALEGGGYASIATVAAVIAALGAGYSFVQSFSQNASQGFADGVIDLKGKGTTKSDSIPARLSRGESVMTAEATAKYKPILEQMQNLVYPADGRLFLPMQPKESFGGNFASSKELKGLSKKLDNVVTAIQDYMPVNVKTTINENGVANLVERNSKNERRRWKN